MPVYLFVATIVFMNGHEDNLREKMWVFGKSDGQFSMKSGFYQ